MNGRMDDNALLRQYVEGRSEQAFAELVQRHVGLVYSAAMRVLGDHALAEETAQTVFVELARKAATIRHGNALAGWLYRVTCHKAANVARSERARRQREMQVLSQVNPSSTTEDAWESLAPVLEEAMSMLSASDQDAVVLRFFQRMNWREVGNALGLSEDAAQKRVSRGLEKMRRWFVRRGVKLTAGMIGSAIAAHAIQATPASLAAKLAGTALAAGTAAGAGNVFSTIIPALAMSKTTATILVMLAVGAVVAPIIIKHRRAPEPRTPELATPTALPVGPASHQAPPQQPTAIATRADTQPSNPLLVRVAMLQPLTPAQVEAYVTQNKRNAESLLAAYRVSTNLAYLVEAATRFPNDPDVQYAVIAANAAPEAQRDWIEAYKASSPDNALAWYFSALDYFKSGQTDLAIQELTEATRKPVFRAELAPTLQAVEELNLSAGRAADEAKVAAFQNCAQVPHLEAMRDLARAIRVTARQYQEQGDIAAAEPLAGMGLVLGDHLSAGAAAKRSLTNSLALQSRRCSSCNLTRTSTTFSAGP